MSTARFMEDVENSASPPAEAEHRQFVLIRSVPLALAVMESVCVFLLGLSKLSILVALSSLLAAERASALHSDKIRVPVLLVAAIGALMNLYMLWNSRRLRNSRSAAWRRRPLTSSQRRRNAIVLFLSLFALILVAAEFYIHPFRP